MKQRLPSFQGLTIYLFFQIHHSCPPSSQYTISSKIKFHTPQSSLFQKISLEKASLLPGNLGRSPFKTTSWLVSMGAVWLGTQLVRLRFLCRIPHIPPISPSRPPVHARVAGFPPIPDRVRFLSGSSSAHPQLPLVQCPSICNFAAVEGKLQ